MAGRSGLHGNSALWVTQLAWSPPGLHFRNLYTAVRGAPDERSTTQIFYCSQRFMQLFRSTRLFGVKISKSVYFFQVMFIFSMFGAFQELKTLSCNTVVYSLWRCFTTGSFTISAISQLQAADKTHLMLKASTNSY